MKVTVTCLGPSVFELEADAHELNIMRRATQGHQRTFKARAYGGGWRTIVAESVIAITEHPDEPKATRKR